MQVECVEPRSDHSCRDHARRRCEPRAAWHGALPWIIVLAHIRLRDCREVAAKVRDRRIRAGTGTGANNRTVPLHRWQGSDRDVEMYDGSPRFLVSEATAAGADV